MTDVVFIIGEICIGLFLCGTVGLIGGFIGAYINDIGSRAHPVLYPRIGFILVTGLMVLIVMVPLWGCTWEQRTAIYSLQDTALMHGSFILGSGQTDEVPVYAFYYSVGNGGFKLGTVPSKYTTIFMDTDTSPYMKTITTKYSQIQQSYELHVPNGTIVQEYLLDTKFK
jgi:hypothetical protein